ncbi:MAG TPA: hypothetical protein HA330_05390, partial [Candidatus Thalassarchaeaceae archaeon]|nr:hypothetical protein [Candidatus Thalassarchaeaceae archaeon]
MIRMWDTIFCMLFVVLLVLWLAGKGASSNVSESQFSNSNNSVVSNESEGISLDPTDISDPANM